MDKINKLIEILYSTRGNIEWCNKFIDFDDEELQNILETQSKNKNLIKWKDPTNVWYLRVELTSLWIRYRENWFKFDKDIQKESVSINIQWPNSGNIAVGDNINQELNIHNKIEKILEIIEIGNLQNKEQLKQLLKEVQQEQDMEQKKIKLEKILSMIWNLASIGQLLVAISTLGRL